MKIALYLNTENPDDLKKARKVLDALEGLPADLPRLEEYEDWLRKLEKEGEE